MAHVIVKYDTDEGGVDLVYGPFANEEIGQRELRRIHEMNLGVWKSDPAHDEWPEEDAPHSESPEVAYYGDTQWTLLKVTRPIP